MAARTKRAQASAKRVGAAASSVRSNPYVQRLIEDDELRGNLREAFESARKAYSRMANGKGPQALMDDKKVQKELRKAAESMREASDQLRGKRRRKGRLGKLLLLVLIGAGLALVFSEELRKAVLDRLFGAEEEFEYTSTTSPAPETASTQT